MHVLFYNCKSLQYSSGPELTLINLANRLCQRGIKVTIVTTKSLLELSGKNLGPAADRCQVNGAVKYIKLPYLSLPFSFSPIPLKLLARYMREVDVAYFVDGFALQDMYFLLSKLGVKCKTIYGNQAPLFTSYKLHNLYTKIVNLRTVNFFDAIHVLNPESERFFAQHSRRPIFLIPTGCDTDRFTPEKFTKRHSKFRVLYLGRLSHQKGIDTFPLTVEFLVKRLGADNFEFNIVGGGECQPTVEKLAQKYSPVRYLGFQPVNALPQIYRQSDLFFAPSRFETLGMTLVEAHASGLPIVSTKISGPSSIVKDGISGRLNRVGDSRAFADSISSYYHIWRDHPDQYNQLRVIARSQIIGKFDADTWTNQFVTMFKKVCQTA